MTRADAVVGQAAVEGVDEVGGGEVADPVSGVDGGDPEGEQQVALAGAGGSDQAHVLRGPDPFQVGQVVEGGRRDRGGGQVELVQRLGDREAGLAAAGCGRWTRRGR